MTRKLLRTLLAASALAVLAAASNASAQTASFQVSANVVKACTISAVDIAFGNYDTVGANATAPLDQTGTVTIRCTRGTAWTVELDAGQNFSGGRRMQHSGGGEFLGYELYSDSGFGAVWDATTYPSGTATSRAAVPLTVYGRIPAAQDVVEGLFSDTIVATIVF